MMSLACGKFAFLARDGENCPIKVWDVNDGQLLGTISSGSLDRNAVFTVFRWLDTHSGSFIVAGTTNGELGIFSSKGQLVRTGRVPGNHSISGIAIPKNKELLFVSTGTGPGLFVFDMNLYPVKTLELPRIEKLDLSDNGEYLVFSCGSTVTVWAIHDEKTLNSFDPCAGPIETLMFVPESSRLFVILAHGEVTVWEVSGKTCLVSCSADRPVASCSIDSDFNLVVTTVFGAVNIWNIDHHLSNPGTRLGEKDLVSRIELGTADEAGHKILWAFLDNLCLWIVWGSVSSPFFQKLDSFEGKIIMDLQDSAELIPEETHKSHRAFEIHSQTSMALPSINVPNLDKAVLPEMTPTDPLKSVHEDLVMALDTKDGEKLNELLKIQDQTIISSTVGCLPHSRIIPLLTIMASRFETGIGNEPILWIKTIFTMHTATLLATLDLPLKLGRLYQTLDIRVEVYRRMLELHGRLDLIQHHMKTRTAKKDFVPEQNYEESSDTDPPS